MSIHIGADNGEIAETVLLPGDPLRAKYAAEKYLENVKQYNNVRGMLGFTGTYKGKKISVQGSGMGIPSISIYAHELINDYGVKNLVRIGSCGAMQDSIALRDVIFALSASTDSSTNKLRFKGMDYAPTVDFDLLSKAAAAAEKQDMAYSVGAILSTDLFYGDEPEEWKLWAAYGVLAVEMETAALYTIAAKFGVRALTILTVSDHLKTKEMLTAQERETSFNNMITIALEMW
jgi:purine-nucleoside phosphorylase